MLFIQIFRKYFIWTLFIQFIYLYSISNHAKMFVNCHTLAAAFRLSLNVTYLPLPLLMFTFHVFPILQHKANEIIASFSGSQCQRKAISQSMDVLFATGFKSVFLFPHTEEKADKIPSWVETALQSSKTTFSCAFRKLVEKFVQLTIIGNQFR